MNFENDYSAFMQSIFLNDISKGESIMASSDIKNKLVLDAIEDFGVLRVKSFLEEFRSSGLKRSFAEYIDF